MKTIIAIDPGKMTGWSEIEYTSDSFTIKYSAELGMEEVLNQLITLDDGDGNRPDLVVIEDFKITTGTGKLGSPDWSLRLIGAVEYVAAKHGIPVVKQTPANAKAFSTNTKLRAVDMWHVGGAGHANDSLRHAMLYMVKHGWMDRRLLDIS